MKIVIKGERERAKERYIQNQLMLLKKLRNNVEQDKDDKGIGFEIWTRYDAQIQCLERISNAFRNYDESF